MKYLESNLTAIVAGLLLLKLLIFGLTPADAAGALFILSALEIQKVVSYKFPKRPDLFKEMSDLQEQLKEMKERSDRQEHELTALKFAVKR